MIDSIIHDENRDIVDEESEVDRSDLENDKDEELEEFSHHDQKRFGEWAIEGEDDY